MPTGLLLLERKGCAPAVTSQSLTAAAHTVTVCVCV